jgi:allantoate deiminase
LLPKASPDRIRSDLAALASGPFTERSDAICRYSYGPAMRATHEYIGSRLAEAGLSVHEDAVGNLIARNVPPGAPAFGIGSHADSNRNGGGYDGILGVVCAIELCRLNRLAGLDFPLQAISFIEEEGSGFGRLLLGSRIMAGLVTEAELREVVAIDDGRPFFEHAREAGRRPDEWESCRRELEGLRAWFEVHIEQGRVLQDSGVRIGLVEGIYGCVHADLEFGGQADHAGTTPMDVRRDAVVAAAATVVELERLTRGRTRMVGTVGEVEVEPGLVNVVPGRARISLDVRGGDGAEVDEAHSRVVRFAERAAGERRLSFSASLRQRVAPVALSPSLLDLLARTAAGAGTSALRMWSGAAHDTMSLAPLVPSAMVFVPCRDGISHSPLEEADPADAALAVDLVLEAIASLARTA